MIKEAQAIKLEEKIEGGIRLSAINEGEELPTTEVEESSGYDKARAQADKLKGDEPINLEDIPF
jgi:hypothetical protein